jgi:hypothetical protein
MNHNKVGVGVFCKPPFFANQPEICTTVAKNNKERATRSSSRNCLVRSFFAETELKVENRAIKTARTRQPEERTGRVTLGSDAPPGKREAHIKKHGTTTSTTRAPPRNDSILVWRMGQKTIWRI